jgi:hypothetical protein
MPSGHHQCLIYAAAMLLDVDVDEVIEILGHDGMETVWPDLKVPHCYKGVHTQEILDVFEQYEEALVCYQVMPQQSPAGEPSLVRSVYDEQRAVDRMRHLLSYSGLILSDVHAYAWDGKDVYDPNGVIRAISEVSIKEFWRLVRI